MAPTTGWIFALCMLCGILCLVSTSEPKAAYSLIFSKTIRPGEAFKVTALVKNAKQIVEFGLFLSKDYNKKNEIPNTGQRVPVQNDKKKEITMQIPATLSNAANAVLHAVISGGIKETQTYQLKVATKTMSLFVQTDKAVYKPGDVVQFRYFGIDRNLRPVYKPITVTAKLGGKVEKQLLNVVPQRKDNGVLSDVVTIPQYIDTKDVKSLVIELQSGTNKGKKTVKIEKYVLPGFEVKISPKFPNGPILMPKTSGRIKGDTRVTLEVSAKNTFGTPVVGKCEYKAVFNGKTLGKGAVELKYGAADVNLELEKDKPGSIKVTAKCSRVVGSETQSATKEFTVNEYRVTITKHPSKTPKYYRPGMPFMTVVEVKYLDGKPMEKGVEGEVNIAPCSSINNDKCYKIKSRQKTNSEGCGNVMKTLNVKVGENGQIVVPIVDTECYNSIAGFELEFHLVKFEVYRSGRLTLAVKRFEVLSSALMINLNLLSSNKVNKVGSDVNFQFKATATVEHFTLLVVSKGQIVQYEFYTMNGMSHEFSVTLTKAMTPSAKFVVIAVSDAEKPEMIADYIELFVSGFMDHEVSLQFAGNIKQSDIRQDVALEVKANAGSYVGALCVDKSVLLLGTGNDITKNDVLGDLRKYGKDKEDDDSGGGGGIMPMFRCFFCGWPSSSANTYEVLEDANLGYMTNGEVKRGFDYEDYAYEGILLAFSPVDDVGLESGVEKRPVLKKSKTAAPRTEFPETWIWSDTKVRRRMFMAMAPAEAGILRKNSNVNVQRVPKPSNDPKPKPEAKKPRAEFPETWIWADMKSGNNGMAVFKAKVPDTITSWVCSAFAMDGNQGLGLIDEPAKLVVKKDFFIKYELPYSVKNGEVLVLQILVFQYTGRDQEVSLVLHESKQFDVSKTMKGDNFGRTNVQKTVQMMGATSVTSVSFRLRAMKVGRISIKVTARSNNGNEDAVIRKLLVEPRGAKRCATDSVIVTRGTASGSTLKTFPLHIPSANVVEGSAYLELSAVGDVMGPALNLNKGIKMPYGCGEQNMINFAPSMFIRGYLVAVNKMDPETLDLLEKVMATGFKREQGFMHREGVEAKSCFCSRRSENKVMKVQDIGGYSAFGGNGGSPASLWLTAFVMKIYAEGKKYMPTEITEEILSPSVTWLLNKLEADGKVPKHGRVIHQDFVGGSGTWPGLGAYYIIALFENIDGYGPKLKQEIQTKTAKTVDLLKVEAQNLLDGFDGLSPGAEKDSAIYNMAIIGYALSVVGRADTKDIAEKAWLKLLAISTEDKEADKRSWEMTNTKKPTCEPAYRCGFCLRAFPPEIEISSYALLLALKLGRCKTVNSAECQQVFKQLVGKRNRDGVFGSTKDTVIATQALAYFANSFAAGGNTNLDVKLFYANQMEMKKITSQNSQVVQDKLFEYDRNHQQAKVELSGIGTALVQIEYCYNEDVNQDINKDDKSTYSPDLKLKVTSKYIQKSPKNSHAGVDMTVCIGQENQRIKGMALVEVNCISGYEPVGDVKCENCRLTRMKISKFEREKCKFVVYVGDVTNGMENQCMVMKFEQKFIVPAPKAPLITFYDYYSSDVRAEAEGQIPTEVVKDVCEQCDDCEGCEPKEPGTTAAAPVTATVAIVLLSIVIGLFFK